MQALFAPAIAIMNRLRYTQKFGAMGVLMLVAIAVLILNLYSALDANIKASRAELRGIAVIKPMQRVLQYMQQHRGMSQGVIAGNEAMKEKRAGKEKEVSEALQATEAALLPELAAGKEWKAITGEWTQIKADGLNWTGVESFSRHTALIDSTLMFMIGAADSYSLTVDPDVDSYYLIDTIMSKAPVALERLGQMRARGTGILTKKEMHDQQKIEMSSLMAELNGALKNLRFNLEKTARFNPGMQAVLAQTSKDFSESAEQINKLIVEDMMLGTFSTSPKDYFELTTTAIDKGYKQMYETMLPTLEQLIERRINRLQQNLYVSIGLAILMLVVVGYFSAGTYYATVNSIRQLSETAHTLSTGDLRPRIDLGTRDELKQVGDSFNEMANAFSALLRNVQASADQVLSASTRMAESSSQITQSTESQSEAASSMAAAVEQMTVGIDHISKNAIEANEISQQAGSLSAEGGRIVGTVVDEIRKIAGAVNDSANIIDELGRQSDQISAIVNVIKEIADQTNLLALNAAIEAARAGESGRGFAVVADEVRKLAERTTKSTQEISAMISAIQSGTQSAVTSMRDGVSRVNDGVVLATQAGEAMGQIQGNAEQVVGTVADISSALREQSAASTEIAKNVEHIAEMAEENNSVVAENAGTAHELERLAEGLQAEIRRFRVS
ncbi:methyl-accepting chemotaxis protein [Azospira restricta]|uniref:Methyl-accepting chemotaxis protein n=1 Tax=Azospira restricta TaxID=404405 RepID=A0A974PW83_9RHOO|nr:methyl-accepting chemotaxis protein [Azospira restricta]QRJ62491.1 methyl-accepting chemotaxis protein [Azospira restricta]